MLFCFDTKIPSSSSTFQVLLLPILLHRLVLAFSLLLVTVLIWLAVCGAKASHHGRRKIREPVKSRFSK